MCEIKILFLGAANRLSLIEQFLRAADDRGLTLRIFSAELEKSVPIAHIAKVLIAPKFKTDEFQKWLLDIVPKNNINIVIPNMDPATISLSKMRKDLERVNVFPVVSSEEVCKVMENKVLSDRWFKSYKLPVPENNKYPLIIKHKLGFGGKNQSIVKDERQKNQFFQDKDVSDYITQNYIDGVEYSVDAYVDRGGKIIGLIPRKRLKIVDGEVNDSLTVRHSVIEAITQNLLSQNVGWFGPITIQYIDSAEYGCKIIEINPRFGGGVTHSIHCGLDMPGWILDEFLKKTITPITSWKIDSLMTRCRRDIFHEHTT
jgi:carbamoyl-phosphate synthase large subunit